MFLNARRVGRVIACGFCVIIFSFWILDKKLSLPPTPSPDIWCFDENFEPDTNSLPEMQILESTRPPIFFVETSCQSRIAGKVVLNSRQACAVESAAKMNPNSDIYVLFVAWGVLNVSGDDPEDRIIKALLTYPNVYLKHIQLLSYTENTILENWYRSKVLHYSVYAQSHTSDLLRYLTLWKYGGTYLDLDVVVTTPLEKLPPNFAGAEDDIDIAAGVLNFDRDGVGHKLIEKCVIDLRDNYRPDNWGANGPGVITRMLKHICKVDKTTQMTPNKCHGFKVYPQHIFYTIPWKKWKWFFNETISSKVMSMLAKSKAIHVWNRFSKQKKVKVGSKMPYGLIAQEYCPKVYKESGTYF